MDDPFYPGKRSREFWSRAGWMAVLIACLGLAVVMVRVPGGLSVTARIGWWVFICGTSILLAALKTWRND